ncbi:hypothetical protein HER14_18360 [Acidithiobacillus thiooxidans]|uniref:hypothetical protein n=1 Tax=Acidithiobacillus thiooxidans TaxID=930 RepID=UPI001C072D1D|nr:hypothetical protein [Acidithiobacillus thiooxidans]MBU2752831.1 hypothetical protein [Acidithiobacillus thiooxidans]
MMQNNMDDTAVAPHGINAPKPKPFRPRWVVWYAKAKSGLWQYLQIKGKLMDSMPVGKFSGQSIEWLAYCVAYSKSFYPAGPHPMEPMTPFQALKAMQDIYNTQNSMILKNYCAWDKLFGSMSKWDRNQLAKTIPIELRKAKLITVYRGVYGQDNINGFSWTTDKHIAETWAGFKKGFVVCGTVVSENIVFCGLEYPPLSSHYGNDLVIYPRSSVTVSVP